MKTILLFLLIALAGCQSGELAKCKGEPFGLNPSHWQPTETDLEACVQTVPGGQTVPGRP